MKPISTPNAPAAIGPYSQAIDLGDKVITSGIIPVVPATGEIAGDTVEAQTEQALTNLKALLEDAGSSIEHVVKTTVFIKDMNDFGKINEIYAKYFTGMLPARSCVEVARLPKDVKLEIEAIAIKKN
ncbi:2-iminobutanoate/2-iminopropanoate deaminase [Lachnospiraceae bacterium]|nr:2-iminobutanoate/2-iminopropanoate deaminase [Lachnospiraceae bacterium]